MALSGIGLPDFPWDKLVPFRERASEYPAGAVDLTIGSPVDAVPAGAREALAASWDSHGYPATIGSPELREAMSAWLRARRGVGAGSPGVLPTIGSKETVALLPSFLGLGPGSRVGFPVVSYPTYDVGARLSGAQPVRVDTDADPSTWPDLDLLWINSPGNPDGHVLGVEQLKAIVAWARQTGCVVASDECYAELAWEAGEAPSILDERVCGGSYSGLLCLYSLSKQSNLAGYRAALLAGDPAIIEKIMQVRKHAGFILPGPVQAVMRWALSDRAHVDEQRWRYERRRAVMLEALDGAGLVNDPLSRGGLYIWAKDAEGKADCWAIVQACAELGIVAAPGDFYGPAGSAHVRLSLTASDDDIREAARRLTGLPEVLRRLG